MHLRAKRLCSACAAAIAVWSGSALGQVPIDGFLPMVGIAFSNEFSEDFVFSPTATPSAVGKTLLGPGGTPRFGVALLDTGAGFSAITAQAYSEFNLRGPYPGETDGYRGTETVTIGGATGQLQAEINDPFGLYAAGMQGRTAAGAALSMDRAALRGQTNVSTITFPAESPLPNILGLPYASQYATRIRNDAPQVFELEGRTIRTPSIEFLERGTGGNGITRKAPMTLSPGANFAQAPVYLPNIQNFDIDNPEENPTFPTLTQGALFVSASATNGAASLGNRSFFFDTGASVTVLSQFNALQLGFDATTDTPEFTVSVVGSGGLLTGVPGFFVDSLTIPALGGSITLTNVPVLVLDVTNPADPGNVVEGILGTNLLAGRNVVIDPNPSLGGGGQSAGLYISDPVTTSFTWTTTAASAPWTTAGSWDAAATPTYLSTTQVRNVSGAVQEAVVSGDQVGWDVQVGGGAGQPITVRIAPGAKLTTFSGVDIQPGGTIRLQEATLDAQYVEVRGGGTLTGSGSIRTGSGPIKGQVESVGGVIAPGDGIGELSIDGRLSLGAGSVLQMQVAGPGQGTEHDHMVVDGVAALGGTLDVSLSNLLASGFAPQPGDRFELMTYTERGGLFTTVNLPAGFAWELDYGDTALTLSLPGLAGDYNRDGVVNAGDYTVWRDGLGTTYAPGHYQTWVANYGATGPATSSAVPEPATLVTLVVGLAGARAPRRRAWCA
ncbi:MAG: retropepsin-like aspartic protease [Lacipirellulaceae bacterium]